MAKQFLTPDGAVITDNASGNEYLSPSGSVVQEEVAAAADEAVKRRRFWGGFRR